MGEYDPGDYLDTTAGVHLYVNGVSQPESAGNLYHHPKSEYSDLDWEIYPRNGSAPLRFGTRDFNSYFDGDIDDVSIFDRKLTATEVQALYTAATQ